MKNGARNTYHIQKNCGKISYTVLFCVSALGEYIPPLVVYKGAKLQQTWVQGGPPDCYYSHSESGYMHRENFESWFTDTFCKATELLEKPVLLIYDGHNSHLTATTQETAKRNKIVIVCLPPHTSHALQPLDVAVFRPLKASWRSVLNESHAVSRYGLDKSKFPQCLAKLMPRLKPEHAVAGFRGSGLYPVNRLACKHRIVDINNDADEDLPTPHKALRDAILTRITPTEAPKKGKRRRVQMECGEVLTADDVIERIRQEDIRRDEKKRQEALGKEERARLRKELNESKKAARLAERKAIAEEKKAKKAAEKAAKKKAVDMGKKVKKARRNLLAGFDRALRADLNKDSDTSSDEDDPGLLKRVNSDKWSSGSSDTPSDMFAESSDGEFIEKSPEKIKQHRRPRRRSPSPVSLSSGSPSTSPSRFQVKIFCQTFY